MQRYDIYFPWDRTDAHKCIDIKCSTKNIYETKLKIIQCFLILLLLIDFYYDKSKDFEFEFDFKDE